MIILSQYKITKLPHYQGGGYLLSDYCVRAYLAPGILVDLRSQVQARIVRAADLTLSQVLQKIKSSKSVFTEVEAKILKTIFLRSQLRIKITGTKRFLPSQVKGKITRSNRLFSQFEGFINAVNTLQSQVQRLRQYRLLSQLTITIYNTKNIRILYDFPSRGTAPNNWAVIAGGTAAGDFNVNNVNTDLVEEVYRSTSKNISISCDTGIAQGIFLDTLAILNHNLTRSATAALFGSNDPTFTTGVFSTALNVEIENLYYISPELPLSPYKFWRIDINDPTNTQNYIQLGTIVFGSAVIFADECFIDEVVRRKTHFADRIRTEGFSSVSNDRALKRSVSLSFRRLNYQKQNYEALVRVIDTTRTSLKALWIPTPQFPSRFAVFGKLSEIPVENHKVISAQSDYIDLDITVDEAL